MRECVCMVRALARDAVLWIASRAFGSSRFNTVSTAATLPSEAAASAVTFGEESEAMRLLLSPSGRRGAISMGYRAGRRGPVLPQRERALTRLQAKSRREPYRRVQAQDLGWGSFVSASEVALVVASLAVPSVGWFR